MLENPLRADFICAGSELPAALKTAALRFNHFDLAVHHLGQFHLPFPWRLVAVRPSPE